MMPAFTATVASRFASRNATGPIPPASRVAAAIAARRACGPPLTPKLSTALTRQPQGQGRAVLAWARRAEHEQSRRNPYNQVSTVTRDCQAFM